MAVKVMKYCTAKAVATRKNNQMKNKYPLFADQIEQVTVEQVIDRKQQYAERDNLRRAELEQQELIEAVKLKQELRDLIGDEDEFLLLDSQVVERANRFGGIVTSYGCMIKNMKKRLEPCSQLALKLLFFLEFYKNRDYSAYELGKLFNAEPKLVSKQLEFLYDCELADTPKGIRTCNLTGKNCCHWMSNY